MRKYGFLVFCGFEFWSVSILTRIVWKLLILPNFFLIKIKFIPSSRWSCRCRSHCSSSPVECFHDAWNPSRVKTLTGFVTTFAKRTTPLESSCVTGGWLYIFGLDNHSWSAKLLAVNVTGLIFCLWVETQSKNCRFCLTSEAKRQILHPLSIT